MGHVTVHGWSRLKDIDVIQRISVDLQDLVFGDGLVVVNVYRECFTALIWSICGE